MRICKKCEIPKDESEFRKTCRGGLRLECQKCENKAQRERRRLNPEPGRAAARKWAHDHKEQHAATKRAWRKKNLEHCKQVRRRQNYGITPEQYDALLVAQDGVCAICKEPGILCVDHDHATGKVRGLLCKPCNTYLGMINDNAEVLLRARDYLQK